MSFKSCMIGLKLNGKLPAGELRADAAPYEAQGMAPETALLRAVKDKLNMALMEERQIVAAVRSAWEAKGGKPKAVKEAKADKPAAKPIHRRVQELMYADRKTALDGDGKLVIDMFDLEGRMTDAEYEQYANGAWQDSVRVPLNPADTKRVLARVNGMQWHHGSAVTDLDKIELRSAGGLFLSSDSDVGKHYAGDGGRVYDIGVSIKNPFFVAASDLTADMESSGEIKKLKDQGFDAIVPLDYGDLVILSESSLSNDSPDIAGPDTMASKVVAPLETGKPVTLYYSRNTESARPNARAFGDVGIDIEPAGEYMNVEQNTELKAPTDKWESGAVRFTNPLVLEHKNTTSTGWKKDLSDMFGGKTGKALTAAVKKAGHDAIITYDTYGLNETVNLGGQKFASMADAAPLADLQREAVKAAAAYEKYDAKVRDDAKRSIEPDGDEYFAASGAANDSEARFADALTALPDAGFALQATTPDGRTIMLNASAQKPGAWQLTRFAKDGAPWGDTQYPTKKQAVAVFLNESDLSTVQDFDGKLDAGPDAMNSLTGDLGMDSALLDHMEAIADERGMVKAGELLRWVRVQGAPGAAALANWLDAMGDAQVSESSVVKFMENSGAAMFSQSGLLDSNRRRLLAAAAAAAMNPAGAGDMKVGKAAPISANVLAQRVDKGVEKILRDGQESGTTSLNGGKALKQAMRAIALTGPKELRALAATIGKLLPDTGTIMLTVDDRRRMNVHGVVELAPFVHLSLFTAEGRTGLSYETVLHEALHIAVAARYRSLSVGMVRGNDKLLGMSAPEAAEAMKQFEQVWEEFRTATASEKFSNKQLELAVSEARGNPDEFFVRAMTDPVLQAYMAGKEYNGKTLWARFKDWVQSSLFGFKQSGTAPSWLDAALAATGDVSQAMGADRADFKRMAAISRVQASRNESRATPKGDQGARDLVITHNLTAENLAHAVKMGGIAVPSLAVTKKDSPLAGFGEITLIGSRSMADPKGYAKTQVFGADIYSPRYPSVEHKLDRAALKKLNDALAPARAALGGRELYPDDVRNARDLSESDQVRYLVLLDMGITIEPTRREDGTVDGWATGNKIRLALADKQGYGAAEQKARDLLEQSGAEERIFNGYNNAGTRKYVPHTLENVVKILKKELRGGENFNYGVGSLRAKFTPQFKSVADIQKNKDRLVSKEQFESVKKEIDNEFFEVGKAMGESLNLDTVIAILEDAPKMGLVRAASDFKVELSDDAKAKAVAFLDRLHHLPTEYFEAKILRDVDLAEFSGAVIPASTPKEVRDLLTARGVPFTEYEGEADRAAAIERFSQELDASDGDVLFSTARVQEDSPEFKKWFGDSMVVNERGEPLVVYHGSPTADFSEFSLGKAGSNTDAGWLGRGFYFGSDTRQASMYAQMGPMINQAVMPVYLTIERPFMWGIKTTGVSGEIFSDDPMDGIPDKAIQREVFDRVGTTSAELKKLPFDKQRSAMQAMSDALREVLVDRGFDGVIADFKDGHREFVAFYPSQIKSATGNNGDFDLENPDIMFSRMPPGPPTQTQGQLFPRAPVPTWTAPDMDKLDTVIHTLQDKYIDMRRVVQEVRKHIANLDDKWDPYLQEELFHGRAATGFKSFLHDDLRPLLTDMQARGVTMEEFEEFLHMRHAEEANEQVASVNPDMQDEGSGVKTADAQDYLANLSPAKKRAYEALAARVDAINAGTQKLLVDYGLEKQSTIDTWNATYDHYVPLHREDMDHAGGTGTGQGFSVRGPASKRRMGSKRAVIDIIANVAMARERAVVRGEKNRLDVALYGMALQAPNPDFWKPVNPQKNPDALRTELLNMGLSPMLVAAIIDEPKQRVIDKQTGLVVKRVNPVLRSAPNVVAVRINGEDRYVFFNERDERAMRMAMSLKNIGASELGRFLSSAAVITRAFAAINTQYNPIFGIVNLVRDTGEVSLTLTTTPIAGKQPQVLAEIVRLFGVAASKGFRLDKMTGADAALWEEFQKEGGITGFRAMYADSSDRANEMRKEIKRMTEGGLVKAGHAFFDWLSDYNTALENVTRMAAYKVAKANGMTIQQAASLAKNATINFNRKGQVTSQVNSLYAFFNAAMQGTARMAQTLKGPAGKKIVAGGLLLGVIQAVMIAAAGFDDEEPPEFIKARNILIPLGWVTGKKDYLTVPMPLGFAVIPTIGRLATEFALRGGKKPGRYVGHMLEALLDTFNPIGHAGASIQTISPTAIDPLVALSENRDWSGKPIARKDLSSLNPTPGYTRTKDTASAVSKFLSYYLNMWTGGTKYQPGAFSPTPDQIDYLLGQLTGGVGRELMKSQQTISAAVSGEEVPAYKIPLLGRFYGNSEDKSSVSTKFYANMLELNMHKEELEGRAKDNADPQGYMNEHPEARLADMAQSVYRELSAMSKHKRELVAKGADRARVKELELKMRNTMYKLNQRVEEAKAKEKSAVE